MNDIEFSNCVQGSLATYEPSPDRPWNDYRIRHLLRRTGFGAPPAAVEAARLMAPQALVDQIIDEAIALPLPEEPEWAYWSLSDYDPENARDMANMQIRSWRIKWFRDMTIHGFREKVALFWHNHFVTRLEDYNCPSYLYQYHKLLQQYALGNFKDLTREMGLTPAMLIFLNGAQNTRLSPNENYARELYELFTLGQGNNYTQQDIEETARALTGYVYRTEACAPITFQSNRHDTTEKTIFGRTGNWGYDDVIDILFDERATEISLYVCQKIYSQFVHPEVDEAVVDALATTFRSNNFELAPVFRQLFKSEHFFDDYLPGTQIKSPIETFVGLVRDGNFPNDNDDLIQGFIYFSNLQDQILFDPTDVAGWPGNRIWLNTNTITFRWQSMELYVNYLWETSGEVLRSLAKTLSNDSNDPAVVTAALADHFMTHGLTGETAYEEATDVFRGEVPQNYFDDGSWNLDWDVVPEQVTLLLDHLMQQPDFQLV